MRRLSKRLKGARTTLAQRNALLDSAKDILARSEHRLAGFKGLDVPVDLAARERATAAAWDRMFTRWRAYVQRLGAVTSRRDLLSAVKTLPEMRTALGRDKVTRNSGLAKLGGSHCELDEPIVTPTVTLPELKRRVTRPPESGPSRAGVMTAEQESPRCLSAEEMRGAQVRRSPSAQPLGQQAQPTAALQRAYRQRGRTPPD